MKNSIALFILFSPLLVFGLHPSKDYKQIPTDLNYEQLSIDTSDGLQLNAWYFPSDKTDKLIIFSHDGVGNMGFYLDRVKLLHHYGFSVLTFDYRGYGQSSSFSIDNYQYIYKEFFTDLESVIKYSSRTLQKDIIVYGWGIGAVISVVTGFQNEKVTGIIADDIFPSFDNVRSKFKQMNAIMTIPKIFDSPSFNITESVQKIPGKRLNGILYFHGTNNLFCSAPEMEKLLADSNLTNKKLSSIKQSQSINNFDVNPAKYAKEIYHFVMVL